MAPKRIALVGGGIGLPVVVEEVDGFEKVNIPRDCFGGISRGLASKPRGEVGLCGMIVGDPPECSPEILYTLVSAAKEPLCRHP